MLAPAVTHSKGRALPPGQAASRAPQADVMAIRTKKNRPEALPARAPYGCSTASWQAVPVTFSPTASASMRSGPWRGARCRTAPAPAAPVPPCPARFPAHTRQSPPATATTQYAENGTPAKGGIQHAANQRRHDGRPAHAHRDAAQQARRDQYGGVRRTESAAVARQAHQQQQDGTPGPWWRGCCCRHVSHGVFRRHARLVHQNGENKMVVV